MPEENKGLENLDKELGNLMPQKAGARPISKQQKPKQAKKAAAKQKIIFAKGKRKAAVARAVLKPGHGIITINGMDASLIKPVEPMCNTLMIQTEIAGGAGKSSCPSPSLTRAGCSGGSHPRHRFTETKTCRPSRRPSRTTH